MPASGCFGGEREVRMLGKRRGLERDGGALAQRRVKRRRFSRKDARGILLGDLPQRYGPRARFDFDTALCSLTRRFRI